MAKSIFDKMENIHEVNRMAAELRRLGMREKLKEPARKPKFIKTVWGVGYTIEE